MAVCTDKGAVVYALPSHRIIYNQTISEAGGILRAEIVNFKEGGKSFFSPVLVTYSLDGLVRAFSIPSLRR